MQFFFVCLLVSGQQKLNYFLLVLAKREKNFLMRDYSSITSAKRWVGGVCWQGRWPNADMSKKKKKYIFFVCTEKKSTFLIWYLFYELFFQNLALCNVWVAKKVTKCSSVLCTTMLGNLFCDSDVIREKIIMVGGWVGGWVGVKKCWRLLIRWVSLKKVKRCWRNTWMVPKAKA